MLEDNSERVKLVLDEVERMGGNYIIGSWKRLEFLRKLVEEAHNRGIGVC